MCPSGATCLSADCCFSELALKNPTKRVGPVQKIAELVLNNNHSLTLIYIQFGFKTILHILIDDISLQTMNLSSVIYLPIQ